MDFDPIMKKILAVLLSPDEYPGWGCFQLSLLHFYYINQVLITYERYKRDLSSKWKVQVPDSAPVTNLTQWDAFVLKQLTPLLLISLPGSRRSCINYISAVQRVKLTGYGEPLSSYFLWKWKLWNYSATCKSFLLEVGC